MNGKTASNNMLEGKYKIVVEVGEYIRCGTAGIRKVTEVIKSAIDFTVRKIKDDKGLLIEREYIKKHSKNIIDLIEVKDVIKYRINNISTTLETKGYVEGIVDISNEKILQKIKSDKNYHILEILTKESYVANCYKVGGEYNEYF